MKQAIITAIADWNPWLEGEPFPEELAGHEREYELLPYLKLDEIKILEGARRTGKSTLLYQVIKNLLAQNQQVLYINFDDTALRPHSLETIYYTYLEQGKITHLFVDEIQQCPDWVSFVRKLYDRKEVKQIWLSGSNASLIKKEYGRLLTGRKIDVFIMPLSFTEYLRFQRVTVSPLLSKTKQAKIISHFNSFLDHGGFPAVTLRSVFQKELLINYFEDFIYKDIAGRYDVDANKIKELGIYLASNSGKIISYRNIAKTLNLHLSTVTDYIGYLKEIFLFDEIYKFDYSLKKQYGHDKKIYIIDTGLANAVSFKFSQDTGRILENAVYIHLKRYYSNIYFHKQKKECDFIIKTDLKISHAIQVCASLADPTTAQREIDGLLETLKTYHLSTGIILTLDEEGEKNITFESTTFTITIKPVWKWMIEKAF